MSDNYVCTMCGERYEVKELEELESDYGSEDWYKCSNCHGTVVSRYPEGGNNK